MEIPWEPSEISKLVKISWIFRLRETPWFIRTTYYCAHLFNTVCFHLIIYPMLLFFCDGRLFVFGKLHVFLWRKVHFFVRKFSIQSVFVDKQENLDIVFRKQKILCSNCFELSILEQLGKEKSIYSFFKF